MFLGVVPGSAGNLNFFMFTTYYTFMLYNVWYLVYYLCTPYWNTFVYTIGDNMNTFDYPPTLYDRRHEVFTLIPAYHPLTVLYRSSVMAMTMLCCSSTEPLSHYQELSLALREQICQDAYAWSEHLFHPNFTDWTSARQLSSIYPGENSTDYIGLASQRDDALGDLSAELYPHPLIRTQMDLMDTVRRRI